MIVRVCLIGLAGFGLFAYLAGSALHAPRMSERTRTPTETAEPPRLIQQ